MVLLILASLGGQAGEAWQQALAGMPLGKVSELNRTNCVDVMLTAFRSNAVVKALIFMPGATDELYFFKRARATMTNNSPTLLEAVTALTNQSYIKLTFSPPLLLLHTDEDPLEPIINVEHPGTVERLKRTAFLPHARYNDRDWDFLQPILVRVLAGVAFVPPPESPDSWSFYRHSFTGWNLNGWETLQALALAGKTVITVKHDFIAFGVDHRHNGSPPTK